MCYLVTFRHRDRQANWCKEAQIIFVGVPHGARKVDTVW